MSTADPIVGSSRSHQYGLDASENATASTQGVTRPSAVVSQQSQQQQSQDPDEEDGDEERMDLSVLQSFANKVQRQPMEDDVEDESSKPKVVIPKRGEKDFEPLAETVNLQEMMLQRSREALFGALVGVRGGSSKSMAHAILTPTSSYPRILVSRGHLLDSLGISVRYPPSAITKSRTYTELLPEEALYLLERGSLQIWLGRPAETTHEVAAGFGEWCEEELGVKGAIEMSVMEAFATFIGKDGLSWERYQAYSYLKRLGYTVQRARRFLPPHFTSQTNVSGRASTGTSELQSTPLPPFRTWWSNLPHWISKVFTLLQTRIVRAARSVMTIGLALSPARLFRSSPGGPLLKLSRGSTYGLILSKLRFIPASHREPVPSLLAPLGDSAYDLLEANPYLPFWNVWKPATPWSKIGWDRGSDLGIARQKPEYIVAVINARDVRFPTISQLSQVFDELPDEPKIPIKKLGPQYERRPNNKRNVPDPSESLGLWSRALSLLGMQRTKPIANPGNPMGALRNGDRALIVAVNDSGNTGWVRFGRTGFSEHVVI